MFSDRFLTQQSYQELFDVANVSFCFVNLCVCVCVCMRACVCVCGVHLYDKVCTVNAPYYIVTIHCYDTLFSNLLSISVLR